MSSLRKKIDNGVFLHEPPAKAARERAEPDWARIARLTLEKAGDLGFIRAGVASLEAFDHPVRRLEDFLASGRHGSMQYLAHRQPDGTLTRLNPQHLLPGAVSALVVALPYPAPRRASGNESESAAVAQYARGEDYHLIVRDKLLRLADEIAFFVGRGVNARVCVDSAPLLERELALRAGFVFLGKNTLAIAPGAGSHFLLGELLLDIPLPPSKTVQPQGCGSCRACLDACPTDAFVGPFELDATKCISYITIESREDVPPNLRKSIGGHLFGCDVCQSVCPFNAAGALRPSAPELEARTTIEELTPERALTLGSSTYKKLVRGSALRRVSRNQLSRNAAVVLGNRGRAEDVVLLEAQAVSHPSDQVRRHCVWALGSLLHRHGVVEARRALDSLCSSGTAAVAAEALDALDLESFEKASRAHPSADTHRNERIPPPNTM